MAVSIEQSLFGDDGLSSSAAEVPPQQPAPIGDWQIDLIRRALDGRRVTEMSERQSLIAEAAGRPLASLRDLSSEEANAVLAALGKQPPRRETASLWDSRDEDTWLDKL